MIKFLKHWNWKEISILCLGLISVVLAFVFGNERSVLAFITSIFSIVSTIFIAKGFVYAPAIDMIPSILYCFICFQEKFYGEIIVYLGVIVPMGIATIIKWFANRDDKYKEFVKINKMSKKEYIIVVIVSIISLFCVYGLLYVLNTSQIIFNTFTLVLVAIAGYLTFRRSPYYSIAYILYDLVCLVMWILTISTMGSTYLPTIISCFIMLLGDIYGLYWWRVCEKKQNKRKRNKKIEN